MIVIRVYGGTGWTQTVEPRNQCSYGFQEKVAKLIRSVTAAGLQCELDPELTPDDITIIWDGFGVWGGSPYWLLVDIDVQQHHKRRVQETADALREGVDLLIEEQLAASKFLNPPNGPVAVRIFDGISAESVTPLEIVRGRRKAVVLHDHDRAWSSCRH